MLDNLLDNADKHGDTGSPVVVETLRDREEVVLAVEDRGPGIAPEDVPHVFEPFYRSARARRRGVAGTGLGLAVVRRIATACGGSVAVRERAGRGRAVRGPIPVNPAACRTADAAAESTCARRPG